MPVNPVYHPLGPPIADANGNITVDLMLQNPVRITRMIMDMTLQKFVADRLFASGGGVTGGAVIYDVVAANEIYLDPTRTIERVAPGSEFPIVSSLRRVPQVATPVKWGGKVPLTYEARDRNDSRTFVNEIRRLANTIVKQVNQSAIDTLEAAVTLNSFMTYVGHSWSAMVPAGATPTAPASTAVGDIALAQLKADIDELGQNYNALLVNPNQLYSLALYFGQGNINAALASIGITDVYASNRVAAGVAYVYAYQQVGEMRVEQPLATETWTDNGEQTVWTQSSVRPLMFVDNPYAVRKITGIA
jgi:hypothetical protein